MGWPQEAYLYLRQIVTPKARPQPGGNLLYIKSDDKLYLMNASGVETPVETALGDVTLNGTQTLTNKNLTSTTNTFPAYVSPVGSVTMFAGAAGSVPTGWLLCDGSSQLRATYPALFTAIGTTYGSVDGTHFTLPDLRGRVPVGLDSGQTEFDVLGETGGEKTHLLTSAEMPAHTHGFPSGANSITIGGTTYYFNQGTTTTDRATPISATASTGGGGAHNNLQPYIVMHYIIRAA